MENQIKSFQISDIKWLAIYPAKDYFKNWFTENKMPYFITENDFVVCKYSDFHNGVKSNFEGIQTIAICRKEEDAHAIFDLHKNKYLESRKLVMEYRIYLTRPILLDSGKELPSEVYDVYTDNKSYDELPTMAKIVIPESITPSGTLMEITMEGFDLFDTSLFKSPKFIPVYDSFDPSILQRELTDGEMLDELEGLRPCFMSVIEYVHGTKRPLKHISDDNEGWEGFKSIKQAWQTAIMNDWVVTFVTKKKADLTMLKAIGNLNKK